MHRLVLCVLVGLAQGCGDDTPGGGGDGGTDSGIDSGIDSGPLDPNGFAALYEDLLLPACAAAICHGQAAGALDMSTRALAYDSLVGVPAAGEACGGKGFVRVIPGDSAGSLLVGKLVFDGAPCGETMPLGGVLVDADAARIAAWIDAGALDN